MINNEAASLIITCLAGAIAFIVLTLVVSWTFMFPTLLLLGIAVFIGRVN